MSVDEERDQARRDSINYAKWAGRWAGACDILASLVKQMPANDRTNAALIGYEQLRAEYEGRDR